MPAFLATALANPAVASLFLQGAKFVIAELRLGGYDSLPPEEKAKLIAEADEVDAERDRLAPRG